MISEPVGLPAKRAVPPLGEARSLHGRKHRILVVAHGYPPNQMAGAEQQMRRKVRWWNEHGHTVRVVAADPKLSIEEPFGRIDHTRDEVDGVRVDRLRFAVADGTRPLRDTYYYPWLDRALRRQVEEFQPEIIYQLSGSLFGLYPLEIAVEHGVPSVLFATDFWHRCQRHTLLRPDGSCCPGPRHPSDCAACRLTARRSAGMLGSRVQKFAWSLASTSGRIASESIGLQTGGVASFDERETHVDAALSHVGLVVCNSLFLTNVFVNLGVDPGRILTIRQGMDDLPPQPFTRREPAINRPLRVLYLGQVTRHKGVDLLVAAVSRLIHEGLDVNLRVHGPVTDGALSIQADGDGRIQLGSPLSRTEIMEILAESDVLVAPSRWFENSPNVILEAQAMGVPVITANHGGMAEMVQHEVDGLLFEPGNQQDLENALRRLVVDRSFLTTLAENAPRPHDLSVEMLPEDQAMANLLRNTRRSAGVAQYS